MPRLPKNRAEVEQPHGEEVSRQVTNFDKKEAWQETTEAAKPQPDAKSDYLRKKQERAARLAAAAAEVLELAKAYEGTAVGRLVPFKTISGEWPALVLGVETKNKVGLGRPTEVVVARVLVFNGRAQLPYINEIELKS